MDREVEAQEKDVGPFRADVLCKDTANGHWVLIENQLERTDRTHLGQLMTSALTALRENPALLEAENRTLLPTQFEVLLVRDLAGKFSGARTFIEHVEDAVPYFYEQVGQYLRAYVAPPPRVREGADAEKEPLDELAQGAEAAASAATDEAQTESQRSDEGLQS